MSPDDDRSRERSRPQNPGRRYSTFVGLAFLVLITIATLNTIRTEGGGILGTSKSDRGFPLPEFAVPDARTDAPGDANVYQDDCATSQNPCPADQQRDPACEIDVPKAIRVCDLFDRPLAISFLFLKGSDCVGAQDAFDAVARRYRGRVNFLIVDVRDDRDQLRQIIDEHGWTVPVGYDADGAVSDLYRVGVCPTVQYAYPGGIFEGATFGEEVDEQGIEAHVKRLLAGSRRRAEVSR
jgi:hypothetical protein